MITQGYTGMSHIMRVLYYVCLQWPTLDFYPLDATTASEVQQALLLYKVHGNLEVLNQLFWSMNKYISQQ